MEVLFKQETFRSWLVDSRGVSKRVAGDIISRCRRIQKVTGVDLSEAVVRKSSFDLLMDNLDEFILETTENIQRRQTLAGSLRYATRLYAKFLAGTKPSKYLDTYQYRSHWE